MSEYRNDILEDAIQTSISYSIENMRLKRLIIVLCLIIAGLVAGYFFI